MVFSEERAIDAVLAGSFPASDPPPWTLGATPPEVESMSRPPAAAAPAAIEVVIAAGGGRRIGSLLEAMMLAALIPVGVFVVGAPLLLTIRGIGALLAWSSGAG